MSAQTRRLKAIKLLIKQLETQSTEGDPLSEPLRREAVGLAYDWYQPKATASKTFIIIYGLTMAGEQDPRLQRFALSFTRSGFQVAIPLLPGLKSLTVCESDLYAIQRLVDHLFIDGKQKVGISAFSAGAGLALVAAAESSTADKVDPLLLFSPYYRLSDLSERLLQFNEYAPVADAEVDHWIWIQLVMAYHGHPDCLLSDGETEALIDMLKNYCWTPLGQKKQMFEQIIPKKLEINRMTSVFPKDMLNKLSPAGKFDKVSSRVLIIHDRNDRVIPPIHSIKIYDELLQRNLPSAQKLLITPILSHVTLGSLWNVLDIFRILEIFAEIFH